MISRYRETVTSRSPMSKKPVIYLIFPDHERAALPRLEGERLRILEAFQEPIRKEKVDVVYSGSANPDQIFNDLETYKDRIAIIHYAGHANSEGLLFDGKLSRAEGLAKAFGMQKKLKLIFLNGCSTYEQESLLRDAKVPITIATSRQVDDHLAAEFAIRFYKSLATRESISNSFQIAAAWLQQNPDWSSGEPGMQSYRHLSWHEQSQEKDQNQNPWNLYYSHPKEGRYRLWERYPLAMKMVAGGVGISILITFGIWISQPPHKWKVVVARPELTHLYGFISNWDSIPSERRESLSLRLDLLPEFSTIPVNGSFRFENIPAKAGQGAKLFILQKGDTIWNEYQELPGPIDIRVPPVIQSQIQNQ